MLYAKRLIAVVPWLMQANIQLIKYELLTCNYKQSDSVHILQLVVTPHALSAQQKMWRYVTIYQVIIKFQKYKVYYALLFQSFCTFQHFSMRNSMARRCSFIPISLVPHSTLSHFLLIDLTLPSLRLIPEANDWVRVCTIAAVCEQSSCTQHTLNPPGPWGKH